jgi:hypothetical protein
MILYGSIEYIYISLSCEYVSPRSAKLAKSGVAYYATATERFLASACASGQPDFMAGNLTFPPASPLAEEFAVRTVTYCHV